MSESSLISVVDDEAVELVEAVTEEDEVVVEPSSEPVASNDEGEESDEPLYAGKYKTIEELEKGYKEASAKLRDKSVGKAPEAYEFAITNEQFQGYDPNGDPMVQGMAEVFKLANLSNEQANAVLNGYYEFITGPGADLDQARLAGEREKLGDEADRIIGRVQSYMAGRNTPGAKALAELAGTNAEALRELESLLNPYKEKPSPSMQALVSKPETLHEVKAQISEFLTKNPDIAMVPAKQREYDVLVAKLNKIQS